MTRTAQSVRNDIASLKRIMNDWSAEGRLDGDTEADCKHDLRSLEEELNEIEEQEPVREKYAPTGGLNIPLACRAFGLTEAELDKWLGEEAA